MHGSNIWRSSPPAVLQRRTTSLATGALDHESIKFAPEGALADRAATAT